MMSTTRILGGLATLILASSIGAVSACSSKDTEVSSTSKETIAAANVAITIQDENGTRVGEGTGLVIAPQLVLTAAHLVAGNASWTIRTSNGKTIKGVRGLTYDWMVYNSNKSHPRKHDVAVIYLAEPLNLPAYPEFATTKLATGSQGTRIRGTGGSFQEIATTLETIRSFPNSYITDMSASETLDTGGVVLNDKNQIVGVVTGKGMTTGKLYIARTDALVSWLSPKRVCAGAAVGIRTYGTPPPGGGTSSGSTSGDGTSGTSGGTSGTSGSNTLPPGSGPGTGTGSGDGNGPNCGPGGDGGGNCSGACGSSGSNGTPSDGSSGNSGDGSSGTSGTPGSSGGGTSGTSGTSGTNPTLPPPGSGDTNPGGGAGTGTGTGGTSGSPGNTAEGGGGAGAGSAAGDGEVCTGESDNPEICPPESNGCSGPSCGGGQPDEFIIYGGTASGDGTNPNVH